MKNKNIAVIFETTEDVNIGDKAIVSFSNLMQRYELSKFKATQLLYEDIDWDSMDKTLYYIENKINAHLYILDEELEYANLLDRTEMTVVYADNKGFVIATALPEISELIIHCEEFGDYELDYDNNIESTINDDIIDIFCFGEELSEKLEDIISVKEIDAGCLFKLPTRNTAELIAKEKEQEKNKEEKNMFQDLIFGGKIDNGQFRMSINGLAVRGAEGKYFTFNPTTKELVEVSNGFFDQMNDLLFTMPALELEKGDIIIHQNKPYYITVSDNNVIKGASFIDATEDVLLPKTNLFGQSYFIKVFNCLGTNNILGSDITSNPTLAYALMGGKEMDLSKILMLQAMSKGEGIADFSSNPMMLMALMGKDNGGDMSDFMKMQMLTSLSKTKKAKETKKAE